jgi:uncharacterized protein YukJ
LLVVYLLLFVVNNKKQHPIHMNTHNNKKAPFFSERGAFNSGGVGSQFRRDVGGPLVGGVDIE